VRSGGVSLGSRIGAQRRRAAHRQVPGGALDRGRAQRARAHQRGLGSGATSRRRRCASWASELAHARNDGIDIERASTTWSTSSFTSYHGQLLSLAVQWGVAIEIERAMSC
jgi:hypothetical protein